MYHYTIAFAGLMALAWALPATGQDADLEDDQVQGEVVEVAPDEERLRLRIEAAGDERLASPGTEVTYRVPPDTPIQIEEQFSSIVTPTNPTLDDLEEGQQVTLDFEDIDGELVARGLAVNGGGTEETTARTADVAQRDDTSPGQRRSRLPETASLLPVLALSGAGFALVALIIRVTRSR